jgi:tetratricopeptide (TPR) repeat protein
VQALAHYDNNEFDTALNIFDGIAETSRILFNCGVIQATLGEHEKAVCLYDYSGYSVLISYQVECYQRAISLDNYLAIAYFQQGVSNFLLGDFEEALANFNDTLLYLRGNTSIDYEQLGLKFRLYSCEVLFNRGLCYIYLQQIEPGMRDLYYAKQEKVTPDHDVIDEALGEQADVSYVSKLSRSTTNNTGLYCLFDSRRCCIPAQRSQGEESQDKRLSGKGETCGCFRSEQCFYWVPGVRNQKVNDSRRHSKG